MMHLYTKLRAFSGPLLLIVLAIVTSVITAVNGGDFDVYLDAARKLRDNLNIYAAPFIKGLQYYYSVFFAWILMPFSNHVFLTEVAWSILSYGFLYRSFTIIQRYFDISALSKGKRILWVSLIALFSYQFVAYNVSMIQITLFLLWAILESLTLIFKGKYTLGGILLGTAINIKLMPVLMLGFLFYRGYLKAIVISLITFVVLLFLPGLTLGWDHNVFLLSEWWSIVNPSNKEHMFETDIGTHSLVALIPVYLTDTIGVLSQKRNFMNLNTATVEMIVNVARLFLLALSLLYFRSLPFRRELSNLKLFWEFSYFILLIPLLLPHQQKYAFLLSIPMITYLLYYFIYRHSKVNSKTYHLLTFAFAIALLLYSPLYGSDILGKNLFLLTQHYRLLTFATLILIPLSLVCTPFKIENPSVLKANS